MTNLEFLRLMELWDVAAMLRSDCHACPVGICKQLEPSDSDCVKCVASWLLKNCKYTNNAAPEPEPPKMEPVNEAAALYGDGKTYADLLADAVKKAVDCMAQADTISSMFRPEINRILSSIKHAGDMANPESAVEHPAHYNQGKIEVWDAVADWGLNFDLGNVVKYVARAGHKDPSKRVEDLKKAMEYLKHELERTGDRE